MAEQDTSPPRHITSPGPARQPSSAGGPDRFLLAIVAGTILLVVASVLIVFVFGRPRATPPADPNSPAGVVQSYITAVRAGEVERSRDYLTSQARADAIARSNRQTTYSPASDDNVRIVVEAVSVADSSAEVKVTVSHFYARSDPFSSRSTHRDMTVRLIREDGAWRMSQPIEPYELY